MAARLAGSINRLGESVGIYRKSSGALDGYGDAAATWSLQATENILLKPFNSGLVSTAELSTRVAGKLEKIETLGYAKSDSVAAVGDYLLANSVKWNIIYKFPIKVGSAVRLTLLCLSRFE